LYSCAFTATYRVISLSLSENTLFLLFADPFDGDRPLLDCFEGDLSLGCKFMVTLLAYYKGFGLYVEALIWA
jgi:hypothetical protein